jgi:ligand-binding sensor domain-containing protein/signal transduction histidine kinase
LSCAGEESRARISVALTQQLRFVLTLAVLSLRVAASSEPGATPVETEAVVRTWRTSDDLGLPADLVTSIIQTRDGFLWVGTSAGLARFDGANFTDIKEVRPPTGMSTYVTALCEDNAGYLWVGTEKDGLFELAGGRVFTFTKAQGLLDDGITSLTADNRGVVWIGTRSGVNIWKGKEFESLTVRDGLPDELVSGIHVARSGTVWITTRSGVCQFTNGRLVPYPLRAESQGRIPENIGAYEDRRGNVWAFGDTYLLNLAENKRFNYFHGNDVTPVRSLCEARDGRLWIGTSGRGLIWFDGNQFQSVPLADFRWQYDVRAICEDKEGNLWVGTAGSGLVQMRPQAGHTIGAEAGLPAAMPTALALDRSGRVLVGLERGGVYAQEADRFERLGSSSRVEDFVSAICAPRDGSVWIGTPDGGLDGLKGGRVAQLTTADGLADNRVTALCSDLAGNVWAGTSAGTLHRISSTNMSGYDLADRSHATVVIPASAGGIWLGTKSGAVIRGEAGTFTTVLSGTALGSRPVLALYEGELGRLWVGTAGGGLACLASGRSARVWNTASGLPSDVVAGIVEDAAKNLWLVTGAGIYRVSRETVQRAAGRLDAALSCKLISEAKAAAEPPGAFGGVRALVSPDDRLWFATSEGLVNVGSKRPEFDSDALPVYIERASLNGRPALSLLRAGGWSEPGSNSAPLVVHGNLASLDVWFTAPRFFASGRVRFRHKLENSDADWVDDGTTRFAHYGRLPYGQYRLRVAVRQPDGAWQEAASAFTFQFPTPLYLRSWAIGSYGVAAVMAIAGVVRVVSHRRLRLALARMEQQRSVERERMRIARDMHDEMGSKLTKISFLSEHAKVVAGADGALAGKIGSIAETSRELLQTMDEIVWVVNPQNDTLEQLTSYLGHYAVEYFQGTSIECDLTLPHALPHHGVSSEARHNLFLAFEEALNNVLKHSGASKVTIELGYDAPDFVIKIADNGRGFAVPPPSALDAPPLEKGRARPGNGLKNMRQRLSDVGGECLITSPATPAGGTSVSMRARLT